MKKLSKIISALLIISMFSLCIYVDEPVYANETVENETAEIEAVSMENDGVDGNGGEVEPTVDPEPVITLETPQITDLSVGNTTATLSFKPVNTIDGVTYDSVKYTVGYTLNGVEKTIDTPNTTVKITGLKESLSYAFRVRVTVSVAGNNYTSGWSGYRSASTQILTPAKPSLSIAAYNKGAILRWKAAKNATSYEIWRYYNKKWSKIKTVTGTSYTNKGLKVKKKYTYKIRAVRSVNGKTAVSGYSNKKSITAKEYLTGDIRMGYNKGKLWKAAKVYKAGSSKKTIGKTKLKTGTKVTVLKKKRVGGKSMAYVKLSSGKKYWIKSFNISFNAPYTTKDYTTETKEKFVNKKGYKSKTKYLLFICHYTQKVYLFKGKKGKWDLQKTFKCATGKASTRTPQGTFKIYKKAKRTPAGSRYVTYFKSWNAFHARPAGSKTIGKPASNGCIRLYTDDAIYIQTKMPKGTTVVSY